MDALASLNLTQEISSQLCQELSQLIQAADLAMLPVTVKFILSQLPNSVGNSVTEEVAGSASSEWALMD